MQKTLILGAGFSKPLGLPLSVEIIPWLWQRWQNQGDDPFLTETKIETEFWIGQAKTCGMIEEPIDFEKFLAFLKSAASLWPQLIKIKSLPTRDPNWPDYISWPPNPDSLADNLTGSFLSEIWNFHEDDALFDPTILKPASDFFARLLQPNDTVLTFNFDSVVKHSLFLAFGRGKSSEGKAAENKISVYHLHGCAQWQAYELPDGKDDDPETTIELFSYQNKTWKLRKTGGEFDLNPYKSYEKLQDSAVQMIPYKSIKRCLASQWQDGLDSLQKTECVIIIGYSFPDHDSVARFAIRTALNANPRAKIINIDPKAADSSYRQKTISFLGRTVEFIPKSWCDCIDAQPHCA